MKIVLCDENIIGKLPNVVNLIYEIFGETDVLLFAIMDENKELGFVARVCEQCVYINYQGNYILFALNQKEELNWFTKEDFTIFCNPLYFIDYEGVQYRLQMRQFNKLDLDGFDGLISFSQYNPQIDTFCKITY